MDGWDRLPGRLVVVSGPSGSGKSTLVRRVLARPEVAVRLSVSATTRAPRPGEEPGRDYFFLSREAFEEARDRGEFLERAEVHGNLYGTPAGPVRADLEAGRCVLLEIDVQGALTSASGCRPRCWSSSTPRASTSWKRGSAPVPPTTRPPSPGDWPTRGGSWSRRLATTSI